MTDLDAVVERISHGGKSLRVNTLGLRQATGATVDGLFQAPLLAVTLLAVLKIRGKSLQSSDVATWTLAVLSRHFEHLELARSHFHWSLTLRRRCAEALVFLENAKLVSVLEQRSRLVELTDTGKVFVRRLSQQPDESGVLVRSLLRSAKFVERHGISLL